MPDLHISPHHVHPNGLYVDQEFSSRKPPRLRYRTFRDQRTWRENLALTLYGPVGIVVVLGLFTLSALGVIWFVACVVSWLRHLGGGG